MVCQPSHAFIDDTANYILTVGPPDTMQLFCLQSEQDLYPHYDEISKTYAEETLNADEAQLFQGCGSSFEFWNSLFARNDWLR
jgi:hypothetical protein